MWSVVNNVACCLKSTVNTYLKPNYIALTLTSELQNDRAYSSILEIQYNRIIARHRGAGVSYLRGYHHTGGYMCVITWIIPGVKYDNN